MLSGEIEPCLDGTGVASMVVIAAGNITRAVKYIFLWNYGKLKICSSRKVFQVVKSCETSWGIPRQTVVFLYLWKRYRDAGNPGIDILSESYYQEPGRSCCEIVIQNKQVQFDIIPSFGEVELDAIRGTRLSNSNESWWRIPQSLKQTVSGASPNKFQLERTYDGRRTWHKVRSRAAGTAFDSVPWYHWCLGYHPSTRSQLQVSSGLDDAHPNNGFG